MEGTCFAGDFIKRRVRTLVINSPRCRTLAYRFCGALSLFSIRRIWCGTLRDHYFSTVAKSGRGTPLGANCHSSVASGRHNLVHLTLIVNIFRYLCTLRKSKHLFPNRDHSSVPASQLREPEEAAGRVLGIVEKLEENQQGKIWDWVRKSVSL